MNTIIYILWVWSASQHHQNFLVAYSTLDACQQAAALVDMGAGTRIASCHPMGLKP